MSTDLGNYSKPSSHSNPPRAVAKKKDDYDLGTDEVVNESNKKGTGSLANQPTTKQSKKTLPNPQF
jgi:hypothetical protein